MSDVTVNRSTSCGGLPRVHGGLHHSVGLVFGVTWNGQHRVLTCTSDRGVEIR